MSYLTVLPSAGSYSNIGNGLALQRFFDQNIFQPN